MNRARIYLVLLLLGMAMESMGQVSYGIKGGVNFSGFYYMTPSSNGAEGGEFHREGELKPSFHIGGFIEIPLAAGLGLQPELIYSQQGNIYKGADAQEYKTSNRLSYLNIPVVLKCYFGDGGSFDLGMQVGFKTGGKQVYKTWGGRATSTTREQIGKHFKAADFGFLFGFSFQPSYHTDISLRYYLGLTNVAKDSYFFGTNDPTYNQNIQLSAGYWF